jgi:hypothetical protein
MTTSTSTDLYAWAMSSCAPDRRQWLLTAKGFACPGCGWADELSRINREEFPDGPGVRCEGVLWRDACRAHGFWGAAARVRHAASCRLAA